MKLGCDYHKARLTTPPQYKRGVLRQAESTSLCFGSLAINQRRVLAAEKIARKKKIWFQQPMFRVVQTLPGYFKVYHQNASRSNDGVRFIGWCNYMTQLEHLMRLMNSLNMISLIEVLFWSWMFLVNYNGTSSKYRKSHRYMWNVVAHFSLIYMILGSLNVNLNSELFIE